MDVFDIVTAANHPTPEQGGPCATCAFRPGTEANQTAHTVALARACVEGLEAFQCHEHPGLCRGWIAAANLRGVPESEEDRRYCEMQAAVAGILSDAIRHGVVADRAAGLTRP